jgi:hypothetical protein
MSKEITDHYELIYPSEFVKAADLRGRDVTVRIVRVDMEMLNLPGMSRKEPKAVATMASRAGKTLEKRFVLNKTNLKLIAGVTGQKRVADWKGKEITLYPTTTKCKGEIVECLRVRAKVNAHAEDVPEDMAAPVEKPAFVDEVGGGDTALADSTKATQ